MTISASGSLSFSGLGINLSAALNGIAQSPGVNAQSITQSIPTTGGGTALKIPSLSNVGWCFIVNRDATNYVDIMTAIAGSSGVAFARLEPGEFCLLRLNPAITAPAALANAAPVEVEILAAEI